MPQMSDVVTTSQIAATLTSLGAPTTANQVHMWHKRAHRNGFPEPIASVWWRQGGAGRTRSPMWDLGDVIEWWGHYEPSKGGGPKGARNGLAQWHRRRQQAAPSVA